MSKSIKKLKKDVSSLALGGVSLGLGSAVVGQASQGTPISGSVNQGLSNVAAQQGTLGTVVGAGALLGVTKEAFTLNNKKRRK